MTSNKENESMPDLTDWEPKDLLWIGASMEILIYLSLLKFIY